MRLQTLLTLPLLTLTLHAQSSHPLTPPVDVNPYLDHVKLLSPVEVIRAADTPEDWVGIDFDVIVNENGRVESAHPTSGQQRFYEQARAIEMRKRFEPIRKNGTIVRAHFTDSVRLLPPERWSPNPKPFPAIPDLKTVSITLQRTHCFGTCPSYQVTLTGTGDITFTSDDRYGVAIPNVAIPGTHHAHVSADTIRALLAEFRNANFFSALNEYRCGWTDLPTETLILRINGTQKIVVDYGGSIVGLPTAVEALESAVDKSAETERWVQGNADTMAALQAEHWNFSSSSQDNIRLFDTAVRRNNDELIQRFLAAKAPTTTTDPQMLSPICAASGSSRLDLVKRMLSAQPHGTRFSGDVLEECLDSAAGSRNPSVVQLWIDHGAAPVWHKRPVPPWDWEKFRPPLLRAIDSRSPEVLSLLLRHKPDLTAAANDGHPLLTHAAEGLTTDDPNVRKRMISLLINAGANVNESYENDPPPLFRVYSTPYVIPLLIAAGANPNARLHSGQTPLMSNCSNKEAVKALLAAGANPMLKDERGETALDNARHYTCEECIEMLRQAMKSHAGQ